MALMVLAKLDAQVTEATYGREYQLQATMDTPSDKYGLRVRNCFAFSDKNSSVRLLNDKGLVFILQEKHLFDVNMELLQTGPFLPSPRCPERSVLSQFVSQSLGASTATLYR